MYYTENEARIIVVAYTFFFLAFFLARLTYPIYKEFYNEYNLQKKQKWQRVAIAILIYVGLGAFFYVCIFGALQLLQV